MAATSAAQQEYPNLNPYNESNGSSTQGNMGEQAKATGNSLYNSKSTNNISPPQTPTLTQTDAASAMDSVKNSQTVQNLQNGPMADKARAETAQTSKEFSNLAASRQTPATTAATGQPLTHYHSMLYTLLSWENPRATAISYVGIVAFIVAWRYLPIVRYGLRLTWIVLGITAAAEIAGKMVMEQGFASKMRPKKYYTIPRETLDSMMGDIEQFINFFVIEFQRILFAENVYATVAAFAASLTTYLLIKITPAWGLALLFTTLAYFLPLIYISNKDLIDGHLNNAGEMIGAQTQQVRDLASQHTSKAMEVGSSTFKQYSARAGELVAQGKDAAVKKGVVAPETVGKGEVKTEKGAEQVKEGAAMTAEKTDASLNLGNSPAENALKNAPSAPSGEINSPAEAFKGEAHEASPAMAQ